MKVIEGYVYPCKECECRGLIIVPTKITREILARKFDEIKKVWSDDEMFEIDRNYALEMFKDNVLICRILTPCRKHPVYGFPEATEIIDALYEFRGKKVRITIEEVNE